MDFNGFIENIYVFVYHLDTSLIHVDRVHACSALNSKYRCIGIYMYSRCDVVRGGPYST